jgi:hypothetical protein
VSQHEPWCRMKQFNHTDAAKRLCDGFNLHRVADPFGCIGKWMAAALNDGSSDGVLYDSKRDAVRHQHHNEQWYTYVKLIPTSMNVCEAEVMLATARNLYDKGMRLTDPDHKHGGPDLIKRLTVEDALAQGRGIVRNLIMPWEA